MSCTRPRNDWVPKVRAALGIGWFVASLLMGPVTWGDQEEIAMGTSVKRLELLGPEGDRVSLEKYHQVPIVVLAFLGTECPLARSYVARLNAFATDWPEGEVVLLGVIPNSQDSRDKTEAFAREMQLRFPLLRDPQARAADQLGATRTPEVFVLDRQRRVAYHGAIDDQFGIGYRRPSPRHEYLKDAVAALRAGRRPTVSFQPAQGCLIGRAGKPAKNATVTYADHIAPLLHRHCTSCHREGDIGPMSLEDFDAASSWAEMIQEVLVDRRMPPWHASHEFGEFANDRSLTPSELALVDAWIAGGKAQGDPAKVLPRHSKPTEWQLQRKPDLEIAMVDEPFPVPAEGVVPYQYFVVDPGLQEDHWVRAAEIRPSARTVVHHVLVFARPKGSRGGVGGIRGYFAGYVPGARVQPYPEGYAKRLPANSEFVFQVHYTPTGTPTEDRTRLGLYFADPTEVTHQVRTTSAVETELDIPPEEPEYRVSAFSPRAPFECQLLSLSPHMHLRGKSFRYTLHSPDGAQPILLDVPRYDFNWQTAYWLKRPMTLAAGSRIQCEAVFDNSSANPNNPNPKQRVRWGEQTDDEMMIGYFDIAFPRAPAR